MMSFPWYRKKQAEERRKKSVEQGLKDVLSNIYVPEGGYSGDEGDKREGKES